MARVREAGLALARVFAVVAVLRLVDRLAAVEDFLVVLAVFEPLVFVDRLAVVDRLDLAVDRFFLVAVVLRLVPVFFFVDRLAVVLVPADLEVDFFLAPGFDAEARVVRVDFFADGLAVLLFEEVREVVDRLVAVFLAGFRAVFVLVAIPMAPR